MNYFPFHIGDYMSATRHLSWAEDCAYRRLLDTFYVSEKPLPLDLRAVCRLVLASTDEQREAVRVVLEEFFVLTEAGWINDRAMREIDEMRIRQDKQREKANKRWQCQKQEPGNAPAMPRYEQDDAAASENDADAMPPTPTPTPTPTPVNLSTATDVAVSALPDADDKAQRKTSGTPKRAVQLPDDFTPDETAVALAAEHGVSLSAELPKFMDYHAARGKPMKDWQAALRTWLRNARQFARPASVPSKSEQQQDWLNRLTGRNGNDAIDAPARRLG
ncbi:MAG: DUF1376 domain-containing protein [Steroidobacteraceae bacterium]|nr:DUF1376 domain-containing protein [Steroidobacteraceae bacterium]